MSDSSEIIKISNVENCRKKDDFECDDDDDDVDSLYQEKKLTDNERLIKW